MIQLHYFTFNGFQENTYILFDETKECIIIDPGCYSNEEQQELVSYISEKEKEKIKGAKVLVIDALRKKEHISHFTLDQALELINEVKVEKSYLTHISHFMGKHNDLLLELPENVLPAFDGLKIEMNE